MFAALLSFLGGGVFRLFLNQVSSWLTARQEHAQEIDKLKLQAAYDAAQHLRNMESIKLQAELGVQTIRVQGEADSERLGAEGFYSAVQAAMKPSGVWIVDLWNGIIRPATATVVLVLWFLALQRQGWVMTPWDMELSGAVLGFFFASRDLGKRGK